VNTLSLEIAVVALGIVLLLVEAYSDRSNITKRKATEQNSLQTLSAFYFWR
jgi:hypothetical protein